jgi:hypothetical membrane protein
MSTTTQPQASTRHADCDRTVAVTRSLLGYGILAGPVYVVVSVTQALLREGFDPTRHQWSLLSTGSYGWIQVANFIVAGLMCVAGAAGLGRALTPGRASRWAPRLVATYGFGLVAAGIFRADPALGFPPGTPDSGTAVSWHGMLHFVAGGIGFTAIAVACLLIGRRYAAEGRTGFAWFSRLTGVAFFAGFAMIASGGGARGATIIFTAIVVLLWTWLSAVAADRSRTVRAGR